MTSRARWQYFGWVVLAWMFLTIGRIIIAPDVPAGSRAWWGWMLCTFVALYIWGEKVSR